MNFIQELNAESKYVTVVKANELCRYDSGSILFHYYFNITSVFLPCCFEVGNWYTSIPILRFMILLKY